MVAFAVHHLSGSLRHLTVDFQQCTVLDEHTLQVSRVVMDMVWYLIDTVGLCQAASQAVESQTGLKPVISDEY